MIDINGITTLISSFGFPIVCCIIMFWYIKETTEQHRKEVSELNDKHLTEMRDITSALNNNTLAIQKLTDYISKGSSNG